MSNPNEKQFQDQLKQRREEQQLFQRFQHVATSKLEHLSRQIQTTEQPDGVGAHVGNSGRLEFGEQEHEVVRRVASMGLREGIMAGIASFVILRRGPKYIGRWVQRRNSAQQGSYQLSDPKKLNATNNPFEKAAQRQDFPRPRGFISRTVWFVFDTMLSLMVGANVSMVYTDKEAIRKEVVTLPLVSGRSLVSDALCDEMIQELKKVRNETNPTFERLQTITKSNQEPTPASFFLEGIVQFCENCERRHYLERQIRQERGLKSTEPVEIPLGGVPKDGPRLMDDENSENDEMDQFMTDHFGHETNWTDDFSSDDFGSDGKR